MSEDQVPVEDTNTEDNRQTQQQPTTRQERRKERRLEAEATKVSNPAPAGMFRKQTGPSSVASPERVKLIKTHITEYANNCTVAAGDDRQSRKYTIGLMTAVRKMFTLSADELKEVFGHLLSAIKDDKGGAFNMTMLYRYVDAISGNVEREVYVGVMDLMTTLARLENPSKIHNMKDVDYVLRHIKNEVAAKAFVAALPGK